MNHLTENESRLYAQLRSAVEEWRDDSPWGDVYLDNARGNFRPREFAALLSNLCQKGLYRDSWDDDSKGVWGEVHAQH
jgi:hypothetical protein